MKIAIDRQGGVPFYQQIYRQIRQQILSGELAPGYLLPPERKLAEQLGVNRTTVLNAYRELKAEELAGSRVGQGTAVLPRSREGEPPLSAELRQEPVWEHYFSEYSNRSGSYVINDLLRLANRSDVISFATGIAAPELGPLDALRDMERELVEGEGYRVLLHSPVEGATSFRRVIVSYMERQGCYCRPEEVMVLAGSQQGIDLVARTLLDPGDIVVMEEPTFFPAIRSFQAAGARLIGVPLDGEGMRVDLLEQLLQRYRPKLIYTMPSYHNPAGTELSLERRRRLLELAYRYKVLILEDDAYGGLCYDGGQLPSLKSMDTAGYVLYLNTFSKIIYPGLRTGWIVAGKKLLARFAAARQLVDLHTNCLSQWLIERFIARGGLEEHLGKVRKAYELRRDTMLEALIRYAPPGVTWNRPRGGYYLWCGLPEGMAASKLLPKAAERGVAFLPGNTFHFSGREDSHMRLNFTFASPGEIERGVGLLCEAVRDLGRAAGEGEREDSSGMELNPIV